MTENDAKQELTKELKIEHWGDGEWVNEPDIFSFTHEGFHCFGKRVAIWDGPKSDFLFGGHWCGYIEVPENHPWYRMPYDTIDCECHGGLTFSDEDEERWIIGFDCAHSFDICPSYQKFLENTSSLKKDLDDLMKRVPYSRVFNRYYRSIDFVKEQCKKMAVQAKEAQEKGSGSNA